MLTRKNHAEANYILRSGNDDVVLHCFTDGRPEHSLHFPFACQPQPVKATRSPVLRANLELGVRGKLCRVPSKASLS